MSPRFFLRVGVDYGRRTAVGALEFVRHSAFPLLAPQCRCNRCIRQPRAGLRGLARSPALMSCRTRANGRDAALILRRRCASNADAARRSGPGSIRSPSLHPRQRLPRRLLPPVRPGVRATMPHRVHTMRRPNVGTAMVGPTIGAQHRLMMALPAGHRDRPHAVGAHVAECHWRPGLRSWSVAHAGRIPRRRVRRKADGPPLRRV
jgi:hypothetical protein